jgi:hypothetical protein
MIGGTDVILENFGLDAAATLDSVARVASRQWPDAVFVDAQRGHRFESFANAEFGSTDELLVFRDEASRAAWERDGFEAAHADAMIYAITGDDALTLVIADPSAGVLRTIIAELQQLLAYGAPRGSWQTRGAAA